jgi:casein kinase II subunit alpha
MHRDIKPHNFIYDISKGTLKVIDWGLSEFFNPGAEYNTKVAARYYKAPELLLGNTHYDFGVDMWGVGCIFAAAIFQIDNFFQGKDDADQLLSIAKVIGTDEIYEYVEKQGIKIRTALHDQLGK